MGVIETEYAQSLLNFCFLILIVIQSWRTRDVNDRLADLERKLGRENG